jgi:hypothetical protein
VLFDLTLPGAPGIEGAGACGSGRTCRVMLSAKDTEVDKAVSVQLGGDD